jgi:hypothetical protein
MALLERSASSKDAELLLRQEVAVLRRQNLGRSCAPRAIPSPPVPYRIIPNGFVLRLVAPRPGRGGIRGGLADHASIRAEQRWRLPGCVQTALTRLTLATSSPSTGGVREGACAGAGRAAGEGAGEDLVPRWPGSRWLRGRGSGGRW